MFAEKTPEPDNTITPASLYMEALGTFGLCYFASMAVMMADIHALPGVGNALVQMFILGILIYAGANISGAHYNGAVTISLMVSGHMHPKKGFFYLLSQLVGSLCASLLLLVFKSQYHGENKFTSQLGYSHCATKNWSVGACFFFEMISTMFLVAMVYRTAVNSTKPNNGVYGFCIAGILGVSVMTIGNITGAALNPWRVIPSSILTGELWSGSYNYAYVYYIGCPIGGAFVGLFWRLLWQEKIKDNKELKNQIDHEENLKLNN